MKDFAWCLVIFIFIGSLTSQCSSNNSYSQGMCACPYDSDSRGNSCGGRSAFVRLGGREPGC